MNKLIILAVHTW